jgi:hypothetical protein
VVGLLRGGQRLILVQIAEELLLIEWTPVVSHVLVSLVVEEGRLLEFVEGVLGCEKG